MQQEEIWAAADALVADGLRPTIERVRQKIGRGSPNTVSPMLEAWFATLGSRLGVTDDKKATTGELPTPVRQAVAKLWEIALLSAQGAAEQGLLQAQQALAADRSVIELREADFASKEQGLRERQSALDEVLQLARKQIADLSARLEQAYALTCRRDAEIEALNLRLSNLETQRVADQRRSEEEIRRHAEERRRLEEHATITEHRLMTELDRERQESRRLRSSLKDAERCAETVGKKLQAEQQALAQKLLDAESELRSERQSLLVADERASELRGLLDAQRLANRASIAQLSQLLSEATLKSRSTAKPRKRVNPKATLPSRAP